MVLQLREICLNCIARSFSTIPNFDFTLLHSGDKEKVIERLANHDLLNLSNKFNEEASISPQEEFRYRHSLIKNFFNGCLNSITFDNCTQLDDTFLELIVQLSSKLSVKSITINNCTKLSG